MIEARLTSVAPGKATGIAGVKGDAAEEHRLSRAAGSGPSEKIRRTVAEKRSAVGLDRKATRS